MPTKRRDAKGRLARDPIAERFDTATADALRRAYAAFGQWIDIYVPPPAEAHIRAAAKLGINLDAPDEWDEPNRWVRACKRSIYRQLRLHGFASGFRPERTRMDRTGYAVAMEWDSSRGLVDLPNGSKAWHIRVILRPEGAAARRAAESRARDTP